MNIDEDVVFYDTYTRLGKLLDKARDRDRAEMEAVGQYPVFQGITYEGTARHPEYTITRWLVDGRKVTVRRVVGEFE